MERDQLISKLLKEKEMLPYVPNLVLKISIKKTDKKDSASEHRIDLVNSMI